MKLLLLLGCIVVVAASASWKDPHGPGKRPRDWPIKKAELVQGRIAATDPKRVNRKICKRSTCLTAAAWTGRHRWQKDEGRGERRSRRDISNAKRRSHSHVQPSFALPIPVLPPKEKSQGMRWAPRDPQRKCSSSYCQLSQPYRVRHKRDITTSETSGRNRHGKGGRKGRKDHSEDHPLRRWHEGQEETMSATSRHERHQRGDKGRHRNSQHSGRSALGQPHRSRHHVQASKEKAELPEKITEETHG